VKVVTGAMIVTVTLFLLAVVGRSGETGKRISKWDFEGDAIDQSPRRFTFGRTGSGRAGRWLVKTEKDAPSGTHTLAQLDSDSTSYRFPIAVADAVSVRDFRLTVRCKAVSGKVDQACGLVFRHRDENNYYVVRANALENNIRLYYVLNGKRQQFAGWDGPVSNGIWHELSVDAKVDHFEIYWNGTKVIDGSDRTFQEAGKVGVWIKADSITYFDDLSVQFLDPK
jgi:hypothetical protein